jgi:hypothetical protein
MRKTETRISGTVEFDGQEYDYRAVLRDPDSDTRPSEVTDIDCADGTPVPDEVDFEALEDLAMQNAELVEWCEQEGWQEEDAGGGRSALIRAPEGLIQRITREGDYSMPQTMVEPVAIGRYGKNDRLLGEIQIFKGGINEWLTDGSASEKSPYADTIRKVAAKLGRPNVNPRWIEAFMRLEYPSLNGVSEESFNREVKVGIACIDAVGPKKAEQCAQSAGL